MQTIKENLNANFTRQGVQLITKRTREIVHGSCLNVLNGSKACV